MGVPDRRRAELRAWQTWLLRRQRLAHEAPERYATPGTTEMLQRVERMLDKLRRGQEAPVPGFIGATDRLFDDNGRVRDCKPARALRQMWLDRQALLCLGVHGALEDWARASAARAARRDTVPGTGATGFDALIVGLSRAAAPGRLGLWPSHERGHAVMPGRLSPLRGWADSASAQQFFSERLTPALMNLQRLYGPHGATFDVWLPRGYQRGKGARDPWGKAWTVAVVATFLDWLRARSANDLALSLSEVWQRCSQRFRPRGAVLRPDPESPACRLRPAVLPTDDDVLHFDLETQAVLAQVLDYNPLRWHALSEGERVFRVELSVKSLGQFDQRRHDEQLQMSRNVTYYRGLTIGQIYAAIAIDRVQALTRRIVRGSTP